MGNSRFIEVNRTRLDRVLCEKVQARVMSQLSTLNADQSYTLREICDDEWWVKTLKKGEPSVAGTYIIHLAVKGKIPLKCIGKRSEIYLYVLTS
jgi:hypothetical protein